LASGQSRWAKAAVFRLEVGPSGEDLVAVVGPGAVVVVQNDVAPGQTRAVSNRLGVVGLDLRDAVGAATAEVSGLFGQAGR
jgi:hypothetical protein